MPRTQPGCLALLTRLRVARLDDNRRAFARLVQQWRLATASLTPATRSNRRVQRLRAER